MTTPAQGHYIYRFRCPECNWNQIIATQSTPSIRQCAWCGWSEIEPQKSGAFATIICEKHGIVTCIVEDDGITPDDFMDLFCPHCDN